MKKKRLIFIIFIFLLPSVSAIYEEKLYTGTVYPGENISINNQTFRFNLGSITEKMGVDTPSGSLIVNQGGCEIVEFFDVCFDGTEFWYHNYTLDKEYFKAKVTVYEILPKIELTRTIENENPLIGEETKIEVNFKNTGDRDATNVIYKDDFPSGFVITDIINCKIEGNGIRWYGTLTTNLEKSCYYKIRALNKTTFSSIAAIQYNKGEEIKTINSTKIEITVPDYQLNVTTHLTNNKINIGEKANFTVLLRNMHSEKNILVESFKISMPIGLKVLNIPERMKLDFNKYAWLGTLTQEDKSMRFFFELKAERASNYSLITDSVFILNNIRKEIKTLDKLKVKGLEEEIKEEPSIDINLSIESKKEEVMAESEKTTTTIITPQKEGIGDEKKEDIKPIKKESIIKKLFNNVFFIILDAIIISLIVIIIIRMVKAKRENY